MCTACCMRVGVLQGGVAWGGGGLKDEEEKNTWKKKKYLTENGLKQMLLIQMQVGGMMFCMSGCVAVSCHRTHTNAPQCGLVCVSPTLLTVKQQGLERIKPINRKCQNVPFSSNSLFFFVCFLMFIGLSTRPLLFLLRTSKPLGGALDNGSHCSASPPPVFPCGFIVKGRRLPS